MRKDANIKDKGVPLELDLLIPSLNLALEFNVHSHTRLNKAFEYSISWIIGKTSLHSNRIWKFGSNKRTRYPKAETGPRTGTDTHCSSMLVGRFT